MYFKPVDEMSLRQLFSTDYAKLHLRLSYIGPVITPTGSIDTSPDALILDMRKSPYKTKRCEFKFVPNSASDFSHNGEFEIAIVWGYGSAITKEQLKAELLQQNSCSEIIALSELKAFSTLANYNYNSVFKGLLIQDIKKVVINRNAASVEAAYILSKSADTFVESDKLIEFLMKKYPSVKQMEPRGRGNVISAFIQTNPPLVVRLNQNNYRWNLDFDPCIASVELAKILRENFLSEPTSDDDIRIILNS